MRRFRDSSRKAALCQGIRDISVALTIRNNVGTYTAPIVGVIVVSNSICSVILYILSFVDTTCGPKLMRLISIVLVEEYRNQRLFRLLVFILGCVSCITLHWDKFRAISELK